MRMVLSVSLPEKMAQDLQEARNVFYAKAKKEGIVTESDMLSKFSDPQSEHF